MPAPSGPQWADFSPEEKPLPRGAALRSLVEDQIIPEASANIRANVRRSMRETPATVKAGAAITAAAGVAGAATGSLPLATAFVLTTVAAPALPMARRGVERLAENKRRTGTWTGEPPSDVTMRQRLKKGVNPVKGFKGLLHLESEDQD
jgi:hypothetical protein